MGFFEKIRIGLSKTKQNITGSFDSLFASFHKVDENFLDGLQEILITADVSFDASQDIIDALREKAKKERLDTPGQIKQALIDIIADMMSDEAELKLATKPSIIIVIGVNGVGKTTTIAKLSALYKAQGKKVILAAADTFRAAAIDQLEIWANRVGVDIVKHIEGSDPASVVFDTINAAKARNSDIIICDTAGRLHNKKHLMDELAKINRIIARELPYSDKETVLVLDATTGQNAINQAKEFKNSADITAITLTKLDGTAKGGMVIGIKKELKIPVKLIGVGEQMDDLQPFNAEEFAAALFE